MLQKIISLVEQEFLEKPLAWTLEKGEVTFSVPTTLLLELISCLKTNPSILAEQLMDVCGVDYPGRAPRFEVVYHLLSLVKNIRLRVVVVVDDVTPVPSLVDLYPSAGWWEREAFDMFGISFSGNPDMRRLLMEENFEGYPLRKDFPLSGYVEVRYDAAAKCVVQEPVSLPQEYRNFDFESPWEGMETIVERRKPS